MKEESKMLSVDEAAEQLNVTRNTIKAMAARGQIKMIRKPYGLQRMFVPADEVTRLLAELDKATKA
jgi:excisionase family DNA binding protein